MLPTLIPRTRALIKLLALLVGLTNAGRLDFTTKPHVFDGLQFLGPDLIKNFERNATVLNWLPSCKLTSLCRLRTLTH